MWASVRRAATMYFSSSPARTVGSLSDRSTFKTCPGRETHSPAAPSGMGSPSRSSVSVRPVRPAVHVARSAVLPVGPPRSSACRVARAGRSCTAVRGVGAPRRRGQLRSPARAPSAYSALPRLPALATRAWCASGPVPTARACERPVRADEDCPDTRGPGPARRERRAGPGRVRPQGGGVPEAGLGRGAARVPAPHLSRADAAPERIPVGLFPPLPGRPGADGGRAPDPCSAPGVTRGRATAGRQAGNPPHRRSCQPSPSVSTAADPDTGGRVGCVVPPRHARHRPIVRHVRAVPCRAALSRSSGPGVAPSVSRAARRRARRQRGAARPWAGGRRDAAQGTQPRPGVQGAVADDGAAALVLSAGGHRTARAGSTPALERGTGPAPVPPRQVGRGGARSAHGLLRGRVRQQVDHVEAAPVAVPGGELRLPGGLQRQVGLRVGPQEPEEGLGDDATADGP